CARRRLGGWFAYW
nr:immunoglobulin heavy chain junction region [Mus musculus]MBK4197611.1 immunoglobulin heavy chain junction region [Mus musculus]MBK4197613.1 immunoglobulin heavy chain junction region [Mus musculus]MBK4197614.1 immunoglobulin heavy chain junction region [Mus musculus]